MESNNAPAGATDEFWAFNPQQPPPMTPAGDDTSLDELLALYQTAQDAPAGAPFAPMDAPDSYDFGASFGDPATDAPFPGFDQPAGGDFGGFDFNAAPGQDFAAPAAGGFDFGGAPADDPFAAGGDPFGAPAADPFGAPAADPFGAPAADPFGAPAAAADAFGAPAADAFGADPFGAPAAGGDPFGADPFGGAPAAHPQDDFSFGESGGGMAAGLEQAGPPFGHDAAVDTSFGALDDPFGNANAVAAADAFGGVDPFGGNDPFGGADPFAAPPAGIAEVGGLDDLFGADAGPVFPALDDTPATPAAAEEELEEFIPDDDAPLFPALDDGPVFPAFDDAPPTPAAEADATAGLFGGDGGPVFPALDDGPTFPAFEEAPATAAMPIEDELFGLDAGPVFPAIDDTPPAPVEEAPSVAAGPAAAAAGLAAAAAQEDDLFGGDNAPVFPAFEETPAAVDFNQAFPEAASEPSVAAVPVTAAADPDATLRFKEVPAQASAAPVPAMDPAAIAALTGREVTIKTADERKASNQQLTQVVGSLNGQLDDVQAKLAQLYAELQRAAVRRASVSEINDITTAMASTRAQLGEGSEIHKQALYLRQLADAYLQLIAEL